MNQPRYTNPEIALETMYHWAGDPDHDTQTFACALTGRVFELPKGAPALILRYADEGMTSSTLGISAKPRHDALVLHPDFAVKGIEAIRGALREYLREEYEEIRETIEEERRKFELRMADLEEDAERVRNIGALLDQEWSAAPCCEVSDELRIQPTA